MVQRLSALSLAMAASLMLAGCLGSGSSSQSSKSGSAITSIAISPQNSAVTVGKTLQYSAVATYGDGSTKDITSTGTWGVSDSNLATVNSGVVTGVKIGVVNVAVASGGVRAVSLLNVTTKSFNQGSLNGAYALTLTAQTSQARFEVGSINADGQGNFSGIEDINTAKGVTQAVAASGTYQVGADGRGSLTLNTAGLAARTFHFVLSANSAATGDNNAHLIQFDKAGTATGMLIKQDSTAFKNSSLANHLYIFRVGGLDATKSPNSTVGEFSVDAAGTSVSSGEEDENDNGTINAGAGANTAMTISSGSIGSVDPNTGRATLSLVEGGSTSSFAIYVISATRMEIVGLDSTQMHSGEAEAQGTLPASPAAGTYTLNTEIGGIRGQFWIMGEVQVDSLGFVTQLAQNQDGGLALTYANPGYNFSVDTAGRGFLQENTTHGFHAFVVYMVSGVKFYVIDVDDAHAGSGIAELQQSGVDGFSTATLNNSFVLSIADTSDGNLAIVGQVVADGAGHLTGIMDVSQPQAGNPSQLTVSTVALIGTYAPPQSSGLTAGSASDLGSGLQSYVMYLDSSSKALFLGISPGDVNGSLMLQ